MINGDKLYIAVIYPQHYRKMDSIVINQDQDFGGWIDKRTD